MLFILIFFNFITLFQINLIAHMKPALIFKYNPNSDNNNIPFSASNWSLTNKIHINNNWSDTALNYDWCSGSGTWNDPYIIENATFNNLNLGNCIEIENSIEYFIIQNCKINYTGLLVNDAGIKLNNTSNGTIINNIITSNMGYGVRLIQSNNNTLKLNSIVDNSYMAIGLEQSNNNTINLNDCNYNGIDLSSGYGIGLVFSDYNNVSLNTASYNKVAGFILFNSSFNEIIQNIGNENYYGIFCANYSTHNQVISNRFIGNKVCYEEDDTCGDNYYYNNDCGPINLGVIILLILFSGICVVTISTFIIVVKKRKKLKRSANASQS